MSTNNDSSFDAFISKIPQFIDPNNLVEPDTPTKKRDLREVISIINQFIKNCADVQPSDASEKSLNYIDLALSEALTLTQMDFNDDHANQLISSYARIYYLLGDFAKAIELYNQICEFSKKNNLMHHQAYAKFQIGKICQEDNELELAKHYLVESKQLFHTMKDFRNEIKCWHEIGILDHRRGKYFNALEHYEKALQLAEENAEIMEVAHIKSRLGVVCRILGDKDESEQYLEGAYKTFKELNDYNGQIESLNNLAMIYLQKSNYQIALTYLNESLELCEQRKNYHLKTFVNLNKALFYLEVGDSRDAAKCCMNALETINLHKRTFGLAKASRIYGSIFKNYHQYKIASYFFEESLSLYQKFEIPLGFANCSSEYAEMLVEMNEIEKAAKHFKMAQEILEDLELFQYSDEIEQTLASPQFTPVYATVSKEEVPAPA